MCCVSLFECVSHLPCCVVSISLELRPGEPVGDNGERNYDVNTLPDVDAEVVGKWLNQSGGDQSEKLSKTHVEAIGVRACNFRADFDSLCKCISVMTLCLSLSVNVFVAR